MSHEDVDVIILRKNDILDNEFDVPICLYDDFDIF